MYSSLQNILILYYISQNVSTPKFTAEVSIGNYKVHSYEGSKNRYDYDKSIRIKPAMQEECHDWNCGESNGYTEKCKVSCYIDGVHKLCDGTREVVEDTCYCIDENGWMHTRTLTTRGRCNADSD